MEILSETIYAETSKEYEQKKKELIRNLDKFDIEYSIIESENGYIAKITYTI